MNPQRIANKAKIMAVLKGGGYIQHDSIFQRHRLLDAEKNQIGVVRWDTFTKMYKQLNKESSGWGYERFNLKETR